VSVCGRIGIIMNTAEGDAESKNALATFTQVLARHGWSEGVNLHMDVRWAAGEANQFRTYAAELVSPQSGGHLAVSTPAVLPLK
jgi:putative ABC transport system substrate-binding protein